MNIPQRGGDVPTVVPTACPFCRATTIKSPTEENDPKAYWRCEACGEMFTCGATLAGCWCAEIKLSEATRAELRSRYQSCLCRSCLESFAESEGNILP